jgi:hypothetical protein
VSFLDSDNKNNYASGLSVDHGPKPSEVYGFVGSITTVVATGFFFSFIYFVWLRVKIININISHCFSFSLLISNSICNGENNINAEIISETV